jgi:hypothetical protein
MNKKALKIIGIVTLSVLIVAVIVLHFVLQRSINREWTKYFEWEDTSSVTFDPAGRAWVSKTDYYRNQFTVNVLEGNTWTTYSADNSGIPRDAISSLVSDPNGNMWVSTFGSGLVIFDGKNWSPYTTQNSGLVMDKISNLYVDKLGRIWITYFTVPDPAPGITLFDGSTWKTYTSTNSGLPSNDVYDIVFDSENRAWIITEQGLCIYDGKQWVTINKKNSGLASDEIHDVAFDAKNRAWIATSGGLSVYDGKEWITYTSKNSGLASDNISGITFDKEQRTWVSLSGENAGVALFDGENWTGYSAADMGFSRTDEQELSFEVLVDQLGRAWVLEMYGDVRVMDKGNWTGISNPNGRKNSFIDIAMDADGNNWLLNYSYKSDPLMDSNGLVVLDKDYPIAAASSDVPLKVFLSHGGVVFLVFSIACLILAILLDSFTTVAIALGLGIITILLWTWAPLFKWPNLFFYGLILLFIPVVNPGVYATIGGVIAAFVGSKLAPRSKHPRRTKAVSLAIGYSTGLMIGVIGLLGFFLLALAWQ